MDVYVIREGRATDGQYQYHCETQAVPVVGIVVVGTASAIGGALYLSDWTCPVTVRRWLNRSLCRI